MADRVPASIQIGGAISAAVFAELLHIIAFEGLSGEWGGEPFDPASRIVGEPLALFDESCAWGKIDHLEAFCVEHELPFVRWSGSYPGEWSPERLVYRGTGTVDSYCPLVGKLSRRMVAGTACLSGHRHGRQLHDR